MDLQGQFLIAMPSLEDPNFSGTIIYMTHYNPKEGSSGIIINRPLPLMFNEILEKLDLAPIGEDRQIFWGGPVQPEVGIIVHDSGYWRSTVEVAQPMRVTVTLDILEDIARKKGPNNFLLALGYAGWSPGQLETEIARNDWFNVPFDPDILFNVKPEDRYDAAITKLGLDPATFKSMSEVGNA